MSVNDPNCIDGDDPIQITKTYWFLLEPPTLIISTITNKVVADNWLY